MNKERLSAKAQFDYTKKVLVNIIIVYGLDTAPAVLASLWQGRGVRFSRGEYRVWFLSHQCARMLGLELSHIQPLRRASQVLRNDTKIMITTSDTTRRLFFQ